MRCVGFYLVVLIVTLASGEICPENTEQSEEVRAKFLDLHNDLRSQLAKGLVKNVLLYNESALQASDMMKLKYDCGAERAAFDIARKCMNVRTPCKWLQGYGENMARVMGTDLSASFAAERAVSKWWREFAQHGHHWNNIYTTELHKSGVLEHYAQMAWSRTTHIGCAVKNCISSSLVVCRYKPTGKRLNDVIYKVGETCSACPRGTTCEQETGLCV